jgi:hypothetical protein
MLWSGGRRGDPSPSLAIALGLVDNSLTGSDASGHGRLAQLVTSGLVNDGVRVGGLVPPPRAVVAAPGPAVEGGGAVGAGHCVRH